MSRHRASIESELLPLFERGMRMTHCEFDDASFGNGVAVLADDQLAIQVVRERGDWFVDVALPGTGTWHMLYRAVVAARGSADFEDGPKSLAEIAKLVLEHRELLVSRLAAPEVVERIRVLGEEWARQLFGDN